MQGDADITIPSDVPTGRREVNKTSTRKKNKNNKTFSFSGFGEQIAGKWRYVSNCKEILKKSCVYENFQLVVTFRIGHLYKGRSGEQNANIDIKGEAQ